MVVGSDHPAYVSDKSSTEQVSAIPINIIIIIIMSLDRASPEMQLFYLRKWAKMTLLFLLTMAEISPTHEGALGERNVMK